MDKYNYEYCYNNCLGSLNLSLFRKLLHQIDPLTPSQLPTYYASSTEETFL